MKNVKLVSYLLVLVGIFGLQLSVNAQDDPSNIEKQMEQLEDQMDSLEDIMDSLETVLDGSDEMFDWDEDKVKIKLDKKSESLTSSHLNVTIGPTFLLDEKVSDAAVPDFKAFRSWSGHLGVNFITRFGHNSPFGLEYGIVYRFVELENDEDYRIAEVAEDQYEFIKDGVDYKETEFYSNYLTIPISLRINDRNDSKFSVSLGGFAGLRINGKEEVKQDVNDRKRKSRTRNDFGLPDFNYGVHAGIGTEDTQIYVTYELTNFFDSEEVYDWNVATVGLRYNL